MAFTPAQREMTPGRYLAAGAIAVALFTLIFGCHVFIVELAELGPTQALISAATWGAIAGGVAMVAAFVPGIPLTVAVHHLLRPRPEEWIHIASFAAVGCLTAVLATWVFPVSGPIVWTLILGTATATGAGRWIVGRENITWRGDQVKPDRFI